MRRNAVVEAARFRRQHIALFICEELLNGVGLLDIRHVPVSDSLPGRVCVTAEDQLTHRGVYLQELRSVGMASESGVDYQARGDLESSVDDFGLASKDLALDFRIVLAGLIAGLMLRFEFLNRSLINVVMAVEMLVWIYILYASWLTITTY